MLQILVLEAVWCVVVLGLIGLLWPIAYRQKTPLRFERAPHAFRVGRQAPIESRPGGALSEVQTKASA
jgi:hypothetical protein